MYMEGGGYLSLIRENFQNVRVVLEYRMSENRYSKSNSSVIV